MNTSPASQYFESQLVTREATQEDDQALRALIAVPMTTRGIQISFQRNQVISKPQIFCINISCMF